MKPIASNVGNCQRIVDIADKMFPNWREQYHLTRNHTWGVIRALRDAGADIDMAAMLMSADAETVYYYLHSYIPRPDECMDDVRLFFEEVAQLGLTATAERTATWKSALNAARITVGKSPLSKEPSDEWVRKMLYSEHSPIRQMGWNVMLRNVPMYVTVHLSRHHEGYEKWICTQREDRTGVPRDERSQTELNDMQIALNAQALMQVSRVRMCHKADAETRKVWSALLQAVCEVDPIMQDLCVPTCIYRGFCPEMQGCGKYKTAEYQAWRERYITTKP